MTFELLKDVSIDYCQRASDGQGQITISYQSNDDVDKILIAYLDAQRFPIGDEGSYFIRKYDGTKFSLGVRNPSNGTVQEQVVFVCGLKLLNQNESLTYGEFKEKYKGIQNKSEMIQSVLVGKANIEYSFEEYDSKTHEYKLDICYQTATECEIPGKFLHYSYRYCGVKFEFPINDSLGREKKSYYIWIPNGAESVSLEAIRTQSIRIRRLEVKKGFFQKLASIFKKR